MALAPLDAPEEPEMVAVYRKLSGVCQQFLDRTIEAETPGGFFLDQDIAVEAGISRTDVVSAVRGEMVESYGTKVDPAFAEKRGGSKPFTRRHPRAA